MNKLFMSIIALIFVVGIVGCVTVYNNNYNNTNNNTQNTTNNGTIDDTDDTISFKFETYGGFVMPERGRQLITINENKIIYDVYNIRDNTITERIEKPITKAIFEDLKKTFADNNFMSLESRYDDMEGKITDVGNAKITMSINGVEKSVEIAPYAFDENSDVRVKNVADKMQSMIEYALTIDQEGAKSLAENWIRNAPTYKYDGQDLKFVSYTVMESYPEQHVLIYNFSSRNTGYGNRTGVVNTQRVTKHSIRIEIISRNIVSATIDDVWDEISQEKIPNGIPSSVLQFNTVQCTMTPWEKWGENLRFVRAVTEIEMIQMYYNSSFNLTLDDIDRIQTSDTVATVCGSPRGYIFKVTLPTTTDADKLLADGWVPLS